MTGWRDQVIKTENARRKYAGDPFYRRPKPPETRKADLKKMLEEAARNTAKEAKR